jgi:hypothetical protein
MGIDEHGFLGEEIKSIKLDISRKYEKHFSFVRKFNKFLNDLKFKLTPSSEDSQKVAIAVLFTKGLETFQAVCILCLDGLTIDAQTLNRSLFEIMIIMKFCSKGEDEYKKYLAKDALNRIKWINSALTHPEEFPQEFFKQEKSLDEMKREYEAILKELGNQDSKKEISIGTMAREVGLADWYHVFYRVVCEDVHSNPRSLEKYISLDERGRIKVLWGPRINEIDVQLVAATEFMLIICKCLSDVFGEPKKEDIKNFSIEKKEIWKSS